MSQPLAFFPSLVIGLARLWPFGLSPVAPGTMGSAFAALIAPWVFLPFSLPVRGLILAAVFVIGGLAATVAERALGAKDPSSVVIDELVGQWLTLLLVGLNWGGLTVAIPGPAIGPVGMQTPVALVGMGFLLFRLFDIWKPGPVRWSEQWLPSGWGIMIDDVLAGCFALICMTVLGKIFAILVV